MTSAETTPGPAPAPTSAATASTAGTADRAGSGAGPAPAAVKPRPWDVRATDALLGALDRLTGPPRAVHQAAVLRIGYGLIFLAGLLREWVNRHELWGADSPWTPGMARWMLDSSGGVSVLLVSDARWWLEVVYCASVAVCVLFVLGWHTRAMSVLFCVVVVSFNSRSILMTDGGDTVLMLMSIYLAFTACGRVWSLDARRLARAGDGRDPGRDTGVMAAACAVCVLALLFGPIMLLALPLCAWPLLRVPREVEQVRAGIAAAAHHCALFVIAAEVCLVYAAAGWYKVQGSLWQDGTAMHYALGLEYFRPWPGLSETFDMSPTMGTLVAYGTVILQVGFPFLVFSRLKYVAVVVLISMHAGIAVLLGLPMFSAAMSLGDALFLPTAFWLFVAARARRLRPGRSRAGRPGDDGCGGPGGDGPGGGGPGGGGPGGGRSRGGRGRRRAPSGAPVVRPRDEAAAAAGDARTLDA